MDKVLKKLRKMKAKAEEDRQKAEEDRQKAEEDRQKAEEDRQKAAEDRARLEQKIEEYALKAAEDRDRLTNLLLQEKMVKYKLLRRHLLNLARERVEYSPEGLSEEDKEWLGAGRVRREGNRAAHSGKKTDVAQAVLAMPMSTAREFLARLFAFVYDETVETTVEGTQEGQDGTLHFA